MRIILSILIISFTFLSCSDALINLSIAKKKVQKYYESGNYENDLRNILADANEKLNEIDITENSLIIFDVDETTLSNYKHIKEINYGYVPELWNEWIFLADAPAIIPVKEFYKNVIKKNIKIAFITGRTHDQYEATYKNLLDVGYTKFDTLIVRKADEIELNAETYKSSKRKELTENGYLIIMNVGDLESDLRGNYSGIKIKLPNYLYIVD